MNKQLGLNNTKKQAISLKKIFIFLHNKTEDKKTTNRYNTYKMYNEITGLNNEIFS